MLGLRKKIACHKLGIGVLVGYYHHFRWPGGHIYRHCRTAHLHLCLHHKTVAGAENLRHSRYALRAISHSRHSLGAAHLIDFGHACQSSGIEYGGIHLAVLARRGAHHYVLATCQSGGHGEHQHGGKQRTIASGNIQPHIGDGHSTLHALHSGHCVHLHGLHYLRRVKALYIACCHGYCLLQCFIYSLLGFGYLGFAHSEVAQLHAIKSACIFA